MFPTSSETALFFLLFSLHSHLRKHLNPQNRRHIRLVSRTLRLEPQNHILVNAQGNLPALRFVDTAERSSIPFSIECRRVVPAGGLLGVRCKRYSLRRLLRLRFTGSNCRRLLAGHSMCLPFASL